MVLNKFVCLFVPLKPREFCMNDKNVGVVQFCYFPTEKQILQNCTLRTKNPNETGRNHTSTIIQTITLMFTCTDLFGNKHKFVRLTITHDKFVFVDVGRLQRCPQRTAFVIIICYFCQSFCIGITTIRHQLNFFIRVDVRNTSWVMVPSAYVRFFTDFLNFFSLLIDRLVTATKRLSQHFFLSLQYKIC